MIALDRPTHFERAEAAAGLFLFALSSCSMIGGCIWVMRRASVDPAMGPQDGGLFNFIAACCTVALVVTGVFLARAFASARSPILVHIAETQPRWGRATKPCVLTWWIWHFLSMTAAADLFWLEYRIRFTSLSQGPIAWLIRFAVVFSVGFAANMFLLLALGVVYRGERLLRDVYKMRFVFDLAFAFAILNLPPHFLLIFRPPFTFLFRIVFRK